MEERVIRKQTLELARATRQIVFNHLKLGMHYFPLQSPDHLFLPKGWRAQTHEQMAPEPICLPTSLIKILLAGHDSVLRRPSLLFTFTRQLKDIKFSAIINAVTAERGNKLQDIYQALGWAGWMGTKLKLLLASVTEGMTGASRRRRGRQPALQKTAVWVEGRYGWEFTYICTRYAQFYAEFLY